MRRVVEYELEQGCGWARCAICLSGERFALDASRIYDTFLNVIEALLALCEGQREAEWVYYHEPHSTHVQLVRFGGRVSITVLGFRDWHMPRPRFGDPGELISEGEADLRRLLNDVIVAGTRMLEEHGEDGYLQRCRNPFPSREFARLRLFSKQFKKDAKS